MRGPARGCIPSVNRKYNISRMKEIHKEIVRRVTLGEKGTDIAKDLGISPVTVTYTRNSALGRRQAELLEAAADVGSIDVVKRIKSLAGPAIELLESVVTGQGDVGEMASPSLKLKAAFDILDRAGHGAPRKFLGAVEHFTPQDLEEIKSRAKNNGVDNFIEAEYNED